MALKALKSPQSAQGTKNKSKNSQKTQNISKKTQEEIVPKAISMSLIKSFKKDKVKKLEKKLSSKKELVKKSVVAKNKIKDESVKLTKEVPTKVLKEKNSIAKTAGTIKPDIKANQGKKAQKCMKKENETEIKRKPEVCVKLGKKHKAEDNKSTIETVKRKSVVKTNKSVIKKGNNKPVKAKNFEENSIKKNVKLGKQFKKQVSTLIKPSKSNKYDEESKNKKVIVAKKEPKEMIDNKNNEKIKCIKSKKRKLSQIKEEKKPEISEPPPIKEEILNYVNALLKYIENLEKDKKTLFESEKPPILLQVESIKIPKVPLHQLRILLVHSIVKPTDDVALFVKDNIKGRRLGFDETIHYYEDLLKKHGCTAVKTIIPLNQVKTEYRQFEMRRKLFGSHDFFLVDGRISGHMAHLLGKLFRQKRKLPTSIHMNNKDLKTQIENALQKTILEIHRNGPTSTVQIGNCSMSAEDISDNIVAVIEKLKTDYPGGWENIRSLRIKTPHSMAIPIYLTFKSREAVKTPVQKPKRPKAYKRVKGKLSTCTDDVHVTVEPDGSLRIIKNSNESDDQNIKESDIKEVIEKDVSKKDLKNIKVEKKDKKEDEDDNNEKDGDNSVEEDEKSD